MADALEHMSHQDDIACSTSYSFSNMMEINQMKELSGFICAVGITETNLHSYEAGQNRMVTMQAPQYFEHVRSLRANKMTLKDQLKENQLLTGQLLSEDLLIRSQREAQTNLVPYIIQMGANGHQGTKELALSLKDFEFVSRRQLNY